MFNIQNYIAKLILSKVERYVKNIKADELQFSLWQGELSFCNLVLDLEVLEQELDIFPFTFISGKIEKLSLKVEWTKINYEPILITINSMEFVVKRNQNNQQKPRIPKRKVTVDDDEDTRTAGYMAALINKILINISVICNNIVLKYVEDDIVTSMNIGHLSVHSADEKWKRAFIEVSASKILFRKLINIIDLTVCLDKRNISSKIEFCQEPIIYKCSMELRLFRKFTAYSPNKLSITRIELHTSNININVSSQQFPMLVRLYELIMALRQGKLNEINSTTASEQALENADNNLNNEESWLTYMWNLIPEIFPEEESHDHLEMSDKKIFEFGFYAEDIKMTFKTQEVFGESIVPSMRKVNFKPLLEIHLQEVYSITIICGIRKFNVTCGASFLEVIGLDDCPCSNKLTNPIILTSGNKQKNCCYLKESFLDPKANTIRKYDDIWPSYYRKTTKDVLLAKTPAFAVDVFHTVEIPDDAKSSDIGSDYEFSNFPEDYNIRIMFNGLIGKVTADTIHRVEKLMTYNDDYEYPPYYEENAIFGKNPEKDDILEVPIKTYEVNISNLNLSLFNWDHDKTLKSKRKLISEVHDSKKPCLELKVDNLQTRVEMPLYSNRLINSALKLLDINNDLFERCFMKVEMNFEDLRLRLKSQNSQEICSLGKVQGSFKKLLRKDLWLEYEEIQFHKFNLAIENFKSTLNVPQIQALQSILKSHVKRNTEDLLLESDLKNLLQQSENKNLILLEIVLSDSSGSFIEAKSTNYLKAKLDHLRVLSYIPESSKKKSLILNYPDIPFVQKAEKTQPFLSVTVQYPKSFQNIIHPPIIIVKIIEGSFNFDPLLNSFLNNVFVAKEKLQTYSAEKSKRFSSRQRQLSITSEKSTRKSLNQLPSMHSSSDCDETLCQNQENEEIEDFSNFDKWYSICRLLLFNIEIDPITIYYNINRMEQEVSVLDSLKSLIIEDSALVINLPTLLISSKYPETQLVGLSERNFPLSFTQKDWSKEKSWFPWKIDLSDFAAHTIQEKIISTLIEPIKTNICLSIVEEKKQETQDQDKKVGKAKEPENCSCSLSVIVDSEQIVLHLHQEQAKLLKKFLDSINLYFLSSKSTNSPADQKSIPVIKENNESVTEVKEILEIVPNSSNTTTKNSAHNEIQGKIVFSPFKSFIQIICSKITLVLFNEDKTKKFVSSIEDVIYSVDKQSLYSKVKMKIDKINGTFYEKINEDWVKNNILGLNVPLEGVEKNNETFLIVTITKAGTKNVHMKWGTYKKNRPLNKFLGEIDANIQQLDLFLNFEAIENFVPLLNTVRSIKFSESQNLSQEPVSVSELPLVLLKSNGIRVFLSFLTEGSDHKSTNVSILKINEIIVDPKVENPIDRVPLRPDLFTKAAQLGILTTAGSKIENRQYQLIIKNMSLSTSNWETIADMINTQTICKTYDNPAFQWNNLENNPKMENCQLDTIFSKLNCSVIFAPCINFKKVLICGNAVELNFLSDVHIDINLTQVALFISIFKEIGNFKRKFSTIPSTSSIKLNTSELLDSSQEEYIESIINLENPLKKQNSFTDKKSLDDSGVESLSNTKKAKERTPGFKKQSSLSKFSESYSVKSNQQVIPYDITIYSAAFYINCSTNESTVFMLIDNPNLLISQNQYEKSVIVTLFDFKVTLDSKNHETLFRTRPGETEASGVPKPFFRVKYLENISKATELDIQIKRPLKLDFSHTKLRKIQKLITSVKNQVCVKENSEKLGKNVSNGGKNFDAIKSHFHEISNINFQTNQIFVKLAAPRQYNFKLSLSSIKARTKVFQRPEKIEIYVEFNNMTMRNESLIILHPWTVQFKVKIVQEYWKKDPLFHVNINSNFIKIDFSAISLKNLLFMKTSFEEILSETQNSNNLDQAEAKSGKAVKKQSFVQLNVGRIFNSSEKKCTVEQYQDDLRAGAFQFVETSTLKDLPLPYQIQIVDREIGIICWRYPQPRALQKIKVFPVPFQTTTRVSITCKIEYYSILKNCFEEFCEFSLTENETKMLDLKNTRLCSEIWRIKIPKLSLKRDSDDDDDYENEEYEFKMHPKILVACLRIDSYFASSIIPNIDVFVEVGNIEINFLNNIKKHDVKKMEESLPETIKDFNLNDDRVGQHTFLSVQLRNLRLAGFLMDEQFQSYELESFISAQIVDYSCFSFVPLMEAFCWKMLVDLNHEEINLNCLVDKIPIKFGSSIAHALLISKLLWERNLQARDSLTLPDLIIHTKYIICNNTIFPINFGQSKTNEIICLLPQSCVLYSFPGEKFNQKIELSICEKNQWSERSEPVAINKEKNEFLHLIDNQYFIISIKSISSTQKKVIINGQVSIFNMSKESFRILYKVYDKTIDNAEKCEAREFDLGGRCNTSIFGKCFHHSQHSMRLKITKCKKGYSGEIPLREIFNNSKPWVVKVPSPSKGGHTTFWVRIIRQTIAINDQEQMNRILVVIWPLFMLKSVLPMNTVANEEDLQQNYHIFGRGELKEFEMSGTDEDEHELEFNANFTANKEDKSKIRLSYNYVDKTTFFKIPKEYQDITKAIEGLEKQCEEKWPCSRDEELRVYRENSDYQNTMPIYNFSSSPPADLSCSLMLTVAPWSLVINSTGSAIKLTNFIDKQECVVKPNDVIMPFAISELFTISAQIDDQWVQSEPIYINTDIKKSISNSFVIPLDGNTLIALHSEKYVFQMLLTSIVENGSRILILSTQFVLTNFTKHKIQVWPFAIESHEKVGLIPKTEYQVKNLVALNNNIVKGKADIKGNPMLKFRDLSKIKGKRKFNMNYNFFVALTLKDSEELSCPIFLNKPVTRKCFNVQFSDKNIPLSLTIIKYQEQYFFSIHEDLSPFLEIKNDTDFNLFVSQTDFPNPNVKSVVPRKECCDDRFMWHQVIPAKKSVFYTPPSINDNFPEIQNMEYGLIFACVSADNIRWSQPVKIDDNKKIIFNVPMFGDLTLSVDIRRKTAQVQINYIGVDSEFTIKDIRKQLMSPTTSNEFTSQVQSFNNHSKEKLHYLEVRERYLKSYRHLVNLQKKRRLNIAAFVKGVNLTLLKDAENCIKTEIISINIDDVGLQFCEIDHKIKLNFSAIQIDNQLFSTGEFDFPVVMCNKNIEKTLLEDFSAQSTSIWDLEEILESQNRNSYCSLNIQLYENDPGVESVNIKLNPIRLYIEDTFINVMLDFVDECIPNNLIYKSQVTNGRILLSKDLILVPKSVVEQSLYFAEPIRLKSIKLDNLHVLISVHTCIRLYIALDHSPLDFHAYEKQNIYTLPIKFGNSIGMHYLSGALFHSAWVVGSLEILGSPSGLARSLTSGFKDFVSMPVQGLFKGPWGFLVGLTHGSASLLKNVTTGTVNSVTKLATSVARNLDRLTLDNEHINFKTDASRRHRPQGITDGFGKGLTGLGISILSAVGGLAHHPLQARSTVEVFTGMGKGIVGVFTKPISGAAEFVALTGQGMLQSVGYNVLPHQIIKSKLIELKTLQPVAEKIICQQLPQYVHKNMVLFCTRAQFIRKNDTRNCFLIIVTNFFVIVDLETANQVIELIPLERIYPITKDSESSDNLFIFKIKDSISNENSPKKLREDEDGQEYHVSNRTLQYVKDITGHQLPDRRKRSENESDEESATSSNKNKTDSKENSPDFEDFESGTKKTNPNDKKYSFYIDEACGKYLSNYINILKYDITCKKNAFSLFEVKSPEIDPKQQ